MHTQSWAYEAGRNEDTGRVMEPRNPYDRGHQDNPQDVQRGKPTVSWHRKAAVPETLWRADGTPPGSESGACISRGNSGTWESHLSPCATPGKGGPDDQKPWRARGASTRTRALWGHHELTEARKVSGRE